MPRANCASSRPSIWREKVLSVSVPPDFFHSRQPVGIEIFYPHHFFQAKASVRAADATCLDPSVGSFADAEAGDYVVHHHGSGLNSSRHRFSAGAISGPDAGGQTIFRIVGQPDRLVLAVERHYGQHRPKGFFAHNAHFVIDFPQYRGRIIVRSDFRQTFSAASTRAPCARASSTWDSTFSNWRW